MWFMAMRARVAVVVAIGTCVPLRVLASIVEGVPTDGLVLLQTRVSKSQTNTSAHFDELARPDQATHPSTDLLSGGITSRIMEDVSDADASTRRGIILRHLPTRNVAICACAKCGSTSLWSWLFESHFGHDYASDPFKNGTYSVQDVDTAPWHGLVEIAKNKDVQATIMKEAFTFALIRDPKERLVSAWKSKVACGDKSLYGTDVLARTNDVAWLFATWGRKQHAGETCMSLRRFVRILRDIHRDGNDHKLNGHFMPQTKGCFAREPPAKWSIVSDVSSAAPFDALAKHLKFKASPEHKHQSTHTVHISKPVADILDDLTAPEYELLGPYLNGKSAVAAGSNV